MAISALKVPRIRGRRYSFVDRGGAKSTGAEGFLSNIFWSGVSTPSLSRGGGHTAPSNPGRKRQLKTPAYRSSDKPTFKIEIPWLLFAIFAEVLGPLMKTRPFEMTQVKSTPLFLTG